MLQRPRSAQLLGDLRGMLKSIEQEERWVLRVRQERQTRYWQGLQRNLVLITLLILGVLAVSFLLLSQYRQKRARAEQALQDREARLRLALDAAQLLPFEVELTAGMVMKSGQLT